MKNIYFNLKYPGINFLFFNAVVCELRVVMYGMSLEIFTSRNLF